MDQEHLNFVDDLLDLSEFSPEEEEALLVLASTAADGRAAQRVERRADRAPLAPLRSFGDDDLLLDGQAHTLL